MSRARIGRRIVAGFLCALVAAFAWVEPALAAQDAKPAELRLSVAVGPALPLGQAAQRWSEHIGEQLSGRFAVRMFPGASLAGRDAAREPQVVAEGGAELAVGSTLRWSAFVPSLGVYSLPWLAADDEALARVAGNEAMREALAQRLVAAGLVLVDVAALGHQDLAMADRAIRAPEDLRGLRIRTGPDRLAIELLTTFGAQAKSMPYAEAQAALAGGELDGQLALPSAFAAARVYGVGERQLTQWGALGEAMVFVAGKRWWDALPEEVREQIRRSARDAIAETAALSREALARQELAQNGVAIVRITAAGHAAFRTLSAELIARWTSLVGADIVTLAERAAAGQGDARSGPATVAPNGDSRKAQGARTPE